MFVGFPGPNRSSYTGPNYGAHRCPHGGPDSRTCSDNRPYPNARACKRVVQRRPGDH